MNASLMRLQINVRPEDTGELLVSTATLLAEIMLLLKVITQVVVRAVVLVQPIRVAEVTEEMVATKMTIQLVVVHVTLVTELAQRMALVALVIDVALATVTR